MSEWQGKVKITTKVGKPVVIDEWAYPKALVFAFEGESDSPDLIAHFEMRSAVGPVCTSLQISAKPGGRGITDDDVRLFNIESLGTRAFASSSPVPMYDDGHVYTGKPQHADEAAEVLRESKKGEKLVRVAQVYLHAKATTGAPLAAVIKLLGNKSTAARRVREARAAGLIPPRGASDADYDAARRRLSGEEASPPRTDDEIREILRRAKEGTL